MNHPNAPLLAAAASLAILLPAAAGPAPIYDAGPFVTGVGVGFGGADVSRRQSGTLLGLSLNGDALPPFAVADDFTLPPTDPHSGRPVARWRLARAEWFFYALTQPAGSTESPVVGARVRLHRGSPRLGAPLIAGDAAANRLLATRFASAYRTSSDDRFQQSNSSPIFVAELDLSFLPDLEPGTYFLELSLNQGPAPALNVFGFPINPLDTSAAAADYLTPAGWQSVVLDVPLRIFGAPAPDATPACNVADIVSIGGFPPADGELTVDDYTSFINAFAGDELLADIVSIGGFPPPDGELTVDDYTSFINAFAEGC